MNIVNKLTWRHMMKNKRRTLVTIIGVIISVAMITAVATLGTSFLKFAQNEHIEGEGEWHILYKDVNKEQLKKIKEDKHTEKVVLSRDLGYSYLEGSANSSKPYMFFKQYNSDGFQHFPIEIADGRIPESEDELLISKHIHTNGQVKLNIGDELTVEIGKRVVNDDEELNKDDINQLYALQMVDTDVNEYIATEVKKTYTIVGIMERPTWEHFRAPGYTVLSYLSEGDLTNEAAVNVSVVWKKVSRKSLEHAQELGKRLNIEEISVNSNLLRYYGIINHDFLRTALYSVAAIVMAIIMIGSISLIYNAFAISVSERSRHLGMLSSVGATKKQKRNSVFFEGMIIGIISIPLGIIAGISGIGITFRFINPILDSLGEFSTTLTVVVTPLSVVIAVIVSALTIFISTYIPARRASTISAIDAIRQTGDIKLSRKSVKTSKLVRKIFGIEAEFGLKNLKRNKRRYIATVFSLVVSIVLFLTVSFFGDQMRVSSNLATSGLNYDIKINQIMNSGEPFDRSLIDAIASMEEVTELSELSYAQIEAELNEHQLYELVGSLTKDGRKQKVFIELSILEEQSLRSYAEKVGVSYDTLIDTNNLSGIIINVASAQGDKIGEVELVSMSPGEVLPLSYYDWDLDEDIQLKDLEVAALTEIHPMGIGLRQDGLINVVSSEEVFNELNQGIDIEKTAQLVLNSSDPLKTHEQLEQVLDQRMYIDNPHQQRQEEEAIILLMSIFTYGFITLITLISVANIFNTISTSIALRKREFGMLKSVGMTPKGFNRMINYESLFYGIQSLLFGLPIGVIIMYFIHRSMSEAFEYPFKLPWGSILGVIVGVFLIVGTAMLYSSSKVKKENIIDALKQENI